MSNNISDSAYHQLAESAYKDEKVIKDDISNEEWKPIHPKGATLHDSSTNSSELSKKCWDILEFSTGSTPVVFLSRCNLEYICR